MIEIIETGYTQGDEFVTFGDKLPYHGFYHKDKRNRYYTGKEHTNESILLSQVSTIPSSTDLNVFAKRVNIAYNFSKHYTNDLTTMLFEGDKVFPTFEDFDKGYIPRYAIQLKASSDISNNIVEINRDNYKKLSSSISIQHYNTVEILWKLTGPLYDLYRGNIRIEAGVRDTNERSLQEAEKVIRGVSRIFPDLSEFNYNYGSPEREGGD